MNLSELLPEHAAPLEIFCNTRRLDSPFKGACSHGRTPASNVEVKPVGSASLFAREDGLRTLVAVLPEQFEAADELVRRRYAWRGYTCSSTESMDAAASHREGQRITLLAEDEGKLLGTLTVRLDSSAGLLAEENYGAEINDVRHQGRRIAEITKLAVEERVDSKSALDALVQSAYLMTHIVHSLTDVFIEVNPRHVRFYQRVLGFAVTAAERLCRRVGAPSVLMQLDLAQFGQRLRMSLS